MIEHVEIREESGDDDAQRWEALDALIWGLLMGGIGLAPAPDAPADPHEQRGNGA